LAGASASLRRKRHHTNYRKLVELDTTCVAATRAHVVEAEKSCVMLGKCTAESLSFRERLSLLSQGIVENDAHMAYSGTKRLLHGAALLGYGFSN